METRHRVEGSLVMNFRRFVNVITAELWRPEVTRRWKKSIFCVFLENDRLRKIFQNSVPKGFIASSIDVLCSNFVKFRRREIGKIVRCLPDKKKQKKLRTALQFSLLHGSRSKSARASPRQRTQKDPDFVQIGSLSTELYPNAWTPSDSAPSESNIRLKPSFEPNNVRMLRLLRFIFVASLVRHSIQSFSIVDMGRWRHFTESAYLLSATLAADMQTGTDVHHENKGLLICT